MNLIPQFLFLAIFSLMAFYLPGKIFLEKFKIKFDSLERLVIFPIIGIFIFTIISIIIRIFQLPFTVIYILLVPITFQYFTKFRWNLHGLPKIKPYFVILTLVLLLGAISQLRFNFFSFSKTSAEITFFSFHDSAFHLSVIGELKNHFPPQHPTFANEALKNYHYLPDFLLAGINSSIPVDKLDLYFRLAPFFASAYFGLAAYMVASQFLKNKAFRILAVILTYFSGSFAFLIPVFNKGADWNAASFMLDQPFDLSFNPQNLLAFAIFLVGFYFVIKYSKLDKIIYLIVAGLIYATFFGFKSYLSALGVTAILAVCLHLLVFKKKTEVVKASLITISIFFISFFLLIDSTKNSIHFSPGWTLKRMVEDPDRLNMASLTILEQHYLEKNNYLRVAQINIREAATYIFGNLGTRILGFIFILTFLKKFRKLSADKIFIIAVVLGSLFIPIFFNQGGSTYNIIQFGPYALILTSIFSATALEKIYIRLAENRKNTYFSSYAHVNLKKNSSLKAGEVYEKLNFIKQKTLFIVIILVFLALSIPVNIKTFIERLDTEKFEVTNSELDVLQYLKEKTNKNSIILVYPTKKNLSFSYVSALSERRVFLSDAVQVELTSLDFETRYKDLVQFFETNELKNAKDFLEKNKIAYIYLTAEDKRATEDNVFFLGLESIINNDSVSLYRVNN